MEGGIFVFKRIISIVLVFALCFTLGLSAQAVEFSPKAIADNYTVQPYYTYTSELNVGLTNSSGKAKCTTTVDAYSNATKIVITMTLQKKTLLWWSEAETWTSTVNDNFASFTKTASVGSGKYRVKAEITVYSGSASESITKYSLEREF